MHRAATGCPQKENGRHRSAAHVIHEVACLPARLGPATAVATATAAEATAATRAHLGTSFVDGEITAAEVALVEHADRLLRLLVGGHLDERKTARLAGGHVAHQVDSVHRS